MKEAFGAGFGALTELPGCASVVVSHGAYMPKCNRGRGRGGEAHRARLQAAAQRGYDYTICTVRDDNAAQITILMNNGWTQLDCYKSSASDIDILIWGREL